MYAVSEPLKAAFRAQEHAKKKTKPTTAGVEGGELHTAPSLAEVLGLPSSGDLAEAVTPANLQTFVESLLLPVQSILRRKRKQN